MEEDQEMKAPTPIKTRSSTNGSSGTPDNQMKDE
jgi:hypothetical protein